ncbi:hypothetical protein M8J77_010300 [Diaphorina citri]|nr:hypothetical protein M8J77_010300 [Diaphorina citri]
MKDVISAVGGIIGASFIPEKWIRGGYLDKILNSHNIMHVLVVYAVYYMQVGSIRDILWMEQGECVPAPA